MSGVMLTVLSVLTFAIGCALLFLPANRYRRQIAVDKFGGLLIVMGFLLMTVFKWTEIAVTVAGVEMQLKAARVEIEELETEVGRANLLLAAGGLQTTESKAEAFLTLSDQISAQLEAQGWSVEASAIYEAIAAEQLLQQHEPRVRSPQSPSTPSSPDFAPLPMPDNGGIQFAPAD